IRLPDALLGTVTVFILYLWLSRRLGSLPALAAALCLAVDPWHVSITRTAHEAGYAPFFMVMAIWALDRSGLTDDSGSPTPRHWAFLAGIMLAFHAWVYPAARLFTPLFCIALCLLYRQRLGELWRRNDGRRSIAILTLGFVIGTLPLWWTALTHRDWLAARASAAVLDFRPQYFARSLAEFGTNFLKNIDPVHLFISANDMGGAELPGTGLHLLVTAPFILAGLLRALLRSRNESWYRLLLAWLLLGVVPAAICGDVNPHALRTISIVIPIAALAGVGADWLLVNRNQPTARYRMTLALISLAAISINAGITGYRYFHTYRIDAEAPYQFSLYNAMQFVAARQSEADFVLVTGDSNQPYIYALFCQPVDPRSLAANPIVAAAGPLGFHQVVHVGKYYFMPKNPTDFPEARRDFEEAWRSVPAGATGLVVETPGRFTEGRLLETFHLTKHDSWDVAYEVRRWRKPGVPR
ncbi:MAG TPA: glycosyltransferase family 39 protein, partial [Phycisphaerae bacterium]|nr:glycosyltransferase family 39 protein [Phycisphaerae bacterium]